MIERIRPELNGEHGYFEASEDEDVFRTLYLVPRDMAVPEPPTPQLGRHTVVYRHAASCASPVARSSSERDRTAYVPSGALAAKSGRTVAQVQPPIPAPRRRTSVVLVTKDRSRPEFPPAGRFPKGKPSTPSASLCLGRWVLPAQDSAYEPKGPSITEGGGVTASQVPCPPALPTKSTAWLRRVTLWIPFGPTKYDRGPSL